MNKQMPLWIMMQAILFIVLFEGLTLFARFALDLQTSRDTASTIGALTFGIRIHHSYIGALLVILYFFCQHWRQALLSSSSNTLLRFLLINWLPLAFGLIGSDLIHHFLVLNYLDGHHHFDLVYPD